MRKSIQINKSDTTRNKFETNLTFKNYTIMESKRVKKQNTFGPTY